MGSRAIVRPWWGYPSWHGKTVPNRILLENTLMKVLSDQHKCDFYVYAMGAENVQYLKDKGVQNVVLADKEPLPLAGKYKFHIHRILTLQKAMEDFDEVVLINWNCRLVKEFPNPDAFWQELGRKEELQAPLFKCTKALLVHRANRIENKTLCSDAFIYCRNRKIPSILMDTLQWPNVIQKWTPEICLSVYIDSINGKWVGEKEYFPKYEPDCVRHSQTVYPDKKENACFHIAKSLK